MYNDVYLEVMRAAVKILLRIVTYVFSFWLGSVVWNWGVADYFGINYYMTFQHAVIGGWFLKTFFA